GPDGWAEAYEYTAAGRTVRFDQATPPVPPILHLTAFHPLDDHYGLGSLEAAAVAVDTHNAAAKWNKALLDNSARPSGALVYDGPEGAVLSDNQFERLKRELEDNYQGAVNAGRRCCSKAGSTGRRCRSRPRTWNFWRSSTPPRARSRSPSACHRCCSAFPATTLLPTTRRPTGCSGGRPCCRSQRASAAR